MKSTINLLPTEMQGHKKAIGVARLLGFFDIITLTALLLFTSGAVLFIVLTTSQLTTVVRQNENLKDSIKNLEQTEQQVFFAKDRIAKAKTILNERKLEKSFEKFTTLSKSFGEGMAIDEVDLGENSVRVSLVSDNSTNLALFLGSLASTDLFKDVTLDNFNFNSSAGYQIVLVLN